MHLAHTQFGGGYETVDKYIENEEIAYRRERNPNNLGSIHCQHGYPQVIAREKGSTTIAGSKRMLVCINQNIYGPND